MNVEKEIEKLELNAPRVTMNDIIDFIDSDEYYVFPQSCLTVCCLTLKNGFTVTGTSACASPENFNKGLGEAIAYENARNEIWALLGFTLKQKLYEASL